MHPSPPKMSHRGWEIGLAGLLTVGFPATSQVPPIAAVRTKHGPMD